MSRRHQQTQPRLLGSACAAMLLCSLSAAAEEPASRQCRLTIGDDRYDVPIGKAFAVKIGEQRVTMRIDPEESRGFVHGSLEFRYPLEFEQSESTKDPAVTIWTLQGRQAAVMVQRYADPLEPKSLVEALAANIAEQYGEDSADDAGGAKKVSRQAVKLRGAGASYEGVQLRASTTGAEGKPMEVVQNVFAFPSGDGVYALVVQDTRAPGEGDSQEYAQAVRMLGESLRTGPATETRRR